MPESSFSENLWERTYSLHLGAMQLYAITNSQQMGTSLRSRIEALRRLSADWANGGVEYVQIREKDLTTGELEILASAVVQEVRGSRTQVLINGRADIAFAVGADGVHLPGGLQLSPTVIRSLFLWRGLFEPLISISCHSLEEAKMAQETGANMILFAPVFEKTISEGLLQGQGLGTLSVVCQAVSPLPVFALGGVNLENAAKCIEAGASGIAAIRLLVRTEWRMLRA
jgi:thiamine-phosphate pyrophosphorylase